MSADIDILNKALRERREMLVNAQRDLDDKNQLIENIRHSKMEIEASIKDIELALSLLRKI